MPSQTRSFSSFASSGSGNAWSSPGNAAASDDQYATVSNWAGGVSQNLVCTNAGFTIPSGARIDGIVLEYEARASVASAIKDHVVQLVYGGGPVGGNRASTAYWPTSDTFLSRGGPSDTWDRSWTADEINSTSFGAQVSVTAVAGATAYIDYVRITVYYSLAVEKSGADSLAFTESSEQSRAFSVSPESLVLADSAAVGRLSELASVVCGLGPDRIRLAAPARPLIALPARKVQARRH